MKCPDCGAEMKPLALSVYCPNDCDRKVQQHIDPEKTEPLFRTAPANSCVVISGPLTGTVVSDDPDLDWSWIDNMDWGGTDTD